MAWNGDGTLDDTADRALLCVNPILGAPSEDFMPRRTHAGGADATGLELGVQPAPLSAQTSAQCRDGVLLVDRPVSPTLRPGWSLGARFKPSVAFLFYEDVRRDAARRLQAYRSNEPVELGAELEHGLSEEPAERANRLAPLNEVEIEDAPINVVPEP